MKHAYLRVADRSIVAAEAAINSGVQEKAAFLSYHAFEASGSALAVHTGLPVGKGVSHPSKLKQFLQAARKVGFEKKVSRLCVRLAPMRNLLLYPEQRPIGLIVLPEDQISVAKAQQLIKEVRHVVQLVRRSI